MKVMSEEQFSEFMTDLSGIIGEIQEARKDFDAVKMREEIVSELKKTLSTKNSLFKSLERESLELESNLIALKNVKKEFLECKTEIETRFIIAIIGSIFTGSFITILMMWFMGKFG
ncbi:hypothetical protein [Sulfurimonas sp.]|jgi:hypothetical protein|uniref:hypothetical protein n=1 Tax=Sulfurimonas sp. TaxID=2022749 RepID=UPI002A36D4C6|nr:hypothetical protein [Sulfurimonas sp.]MDY0122842.1 hypothetical protein [Sulfurimonas sp.]